RRPPEPFFDKTPNLYLAALPPDQRSPFEPADELHPAKKDKKPEEKKPEESTEAETKTPKKLKEEAGGKTGASPTNKPVEVTIEWAGVEARIWEVPVPPGNYSELAVNDKRLFWMTRDTGVEAKQHLQVLDIGNEDPKPKNFAEDIRWYELSLDGKKVVVRKKDEFHVENASATAPAKLEKSVDLKS